MSWDSQQEPLFFFLLKRTFTEEEKKKLETKKKRLRLHSRLLSSLKKDEYKTDPKILDLHR